MKRIDSFKIAIQILWKSSKIYFILTLLINIFCAIPSIVNLLVWKKILDLIYGFLMGNSTSYYVVLGYILLHFILTVSTNILNRCSSFMQSIYSLLVQRFVTNETIDTIMCMELVDLEDANIHNTVEKANGQSCERIMSLMGKLEDFIKNVVTFFGVSGILISFNPILYVIIFVSIIPIAIYSHGYYTKIFQMYNGRFEKLRYSNELKNTISKSEIFKELKLFSSIPYLKEKINIILDEVISEEKRVRKKLNTQGTISEMLQVFLTYVLKGSIIFLGMIGHYSIGTINMNMESAGNIQGAITNIITLIIAVYEDCLYLDAFMELTQIKKDKVLYENSREVIKDFTIKTIEFENVWFKYDKNDNYVIKNFSYKFMIGKTYAIVGCNGSGKTTLVKIIMGLYKPQKGKILINGKSIDAYDKKEYYKKMSAVFQDFARYPLTIRENIGMGNIAESNDIQKIELAAEKSYSQEFIKALPNQYEEKLIRGWKDSIDLSIGQWQRIAIARANMRYATVVIFDEPSASLDAKTESKVLGDVVNNKNNKIGIVITHRFLNIKRVDEILVLNKGDRSERALSETQ